MRQDSKEVRLARSWSLGEATRGTGIVWNSSRKRRGEWVLDCEREKSSYVNRRGIRRNQGVREILGLGGILNFKNKK